MDVAGLFDVRGKRALVTGASGGIGYMIADGLAAAGVDLLICSRKDDALQAAAARLRAHGGDVRGFAADLATVEGIRVVADAVGAEPLHILVNNAGAVWGAPLDAFPRAGFEKVLALNLLAPFEVTKAALPALRAAGTAADPARVINIATVDGMRVPDWETYPYSASKAGLIHLSRHLGKFLASERIAVNSIAPGLFQSRMSGTMFDFDDPDRMAEAVSPLGGRIGTAEDIVGAVIYLSSRAGAWLSGVTLPVGGGVGTIE